MRQRSPSVWAAAVAVLASTSACAVDVPVAESPVTPATQALITPTGGPCPSFGCGSNSPVIDVFEIHELSLRPGERNLEGFALALASGRPQIVQGQDVYELRVKDGRISGWHKGRPRLFGAALVDATIPVTRGKQRYELVIRTARDLTFYVAPFDPIEAYTLEWREVGRDGPTTNLCNNRKELERQIKEDPENGQRELMGMAVGESVVFEGDRVRVAGMTMDRAADDLWFNLGCAGHTLSKLRLTHNTVHGQDPALVRAWEHRQATLKMLVADYCNTGATFTVAGQPLVWQSPEVSFFRTPRELEARWDHKGATCLYAPRMLFPTPLGFATFPDIWTSLSDAGCAVPRCSNLTPADYDGALRVSANP